MIEPGPRAVETQSARPEEANLREIERAIASLPEPGKHQFAAWARIWLAEHERARRAATVERKRIKRERDSEFLGKTPFYRTPALRWTVISLLCFLVAESALFRSGWYNKYLEPDSSAGTVETHLFWIRHTLPASVPEVLVVGDSRIGEGFSARAADAAARNRVHFWNEGLWGTNPRVWYYFLRDADPMRRRFAAIVLTLDYADRDSYDSPPGRLIDLNFVIGRLRISDCPEFALSMNKPELQAKAFAGCLFPGIPLRRDVNEFLANIRGRVDHAKDWRNRGLGYVNGYEGTDRTLTGLSADWSARRINFPGGLTDAQRTSIKAILMPEVPSPTGETTRYRRLWLGKIARLYAHSPTRIILLEPPRAPLAKPDDHAPHTSVEELLRLPRVSALPEDLFHNLEWPELFQDGLHMNHDGREIFSARVGEQIPALIGIH